MSLIVQKFGGTSVADINRIKEVAKIIIQEIKQGHDTVVVVSAMAGVTNSLISKCSEVSLLNCPDHLREYDTIVSSGEIITAGILALELQTNGIAASSLQGWQVPIHTNSNFAKALVTNIDIKLLTDLVKRNIVPIVTGFQGITEDNNITTLGKGGSDTTAALLAAALGAVRCDIYTDVEGIYSADPRIVHEARKISEMSIAEAMELSSAGAKVMHPRAALAAMQYNFEMRILSSFLNINGTLITTGKQIMENRLITAITYNKNLIKININHPGRKIISILSQFAAGGLELDHIQTIDPCNSYIIGSLSDRNKFEAALKQSAIALPVINFTIDTGISTVTLVGYGIKNDPYFCWQVLDVLMQEGIDILSAQTSEIKLTLLIEDQETERSVKILHRHFI